MTRKTLSVPRLLIALLILTALVSGQRTAASSRSGRARVLEPCGPMSSPRASHTATRLADGRVLVAGGMERNGVFLDTAEIFDPATGRFSPTPPLSARRVGHTATALPDGTVLIVGGLRGRRQERGRWIGDALATAEIYEPARGRFLSVGPPGSARTSHAAVRLSGGEVLIAGGSDGERTLSSAEIYDPATRRFRPVGAMRVPRTPYGALLLPDGRAFFAGGSGDDGRVLADVELFDPARRVFLPAGGLRIPRHKHSATLLADGRVLVAGGSDDRDWRGQLDHAEVCDPAAGVCRPIAALRSARFKHGAAVAVVADARVLFAGGAAAPELYDPRSERFLPLAARFPEPRYFATATTLADGRVLVAGGYGAGKPDTGPLSTSAAWTLSP